LSSPGVAAMRSLGRNSVFVSVLVLGLLASGHAFQTTTRLPSELSDQAFWALISDLSEPGGSFGSENFVSNERSFQHVLDELPKGRQPASAYIGVGPEQNFTYILALKPQIAFIVDIRRQNLVQHLMYKALFELSADRAEFLARLFSRARPEGLGRAATVEVLFDAFEGGSADPKQFEENLQTIAEHLKTAHGFKLTGTDELMLQRVVWAFAAGGPYLTYAGPRFTPGGVYPTFREIMSETDKTGAHRSFLASEENFLAIRALHKKNLLVPVVGDFAGPVALRGVGQYLRERNATVSSFYTSNVEQYLFQTTAWRGFYANASTLPVNANSVFIRGLIRSATGDYSPSPGLPPTSRYETVLFSIPDLVKAFSAGGIRSYYDILEPARTATPATLVR